MNASLVSGLISPVDIAVSGGNLFVTDSVTGTIGEYNATTGATVDADLVSGLDGPGGIAVFGGHLFVTSFRTGTIGEYTISGETVNESLVSGLNQPTDIAAVSETAADLCITNADSPDPVIAGSNPTYTLTITNSGPVTAALVTVTDISPDETTFVSCSSTGGGVCNGSDNNHTVTFAALAVGESESITFVASVNCSVVDGTTISNTATVSFFYT